MQLTLFSDYSLRVLLFLGMHTDRLVTVAELSRAYNISQHHLVKVTGNLVRLGALEAIRGRSGGLRLAKEPSALSLGQIVRQTEPNFHTVECFDQEQNTCPITPVCQLKSVMYEATQQFLCVLDRYTLADVIEHPERYRPYFERPTTARGRHKTSSTFDA